MNNKKIFVSLILCLLGIAAYAQNPLSASLTIKITSEWSGGDVLVFMEKSTYSDTEADYGADVDKMPNTGEGSINLYGIVGSKHYSTVAKKQLEGSLIGLVTNEYDSHYDVEFTTASYAEGRDTLFFEDLEKGTLTKIVKGTKFSIDFETAAVRTIDNRFRIYKAPVFQVCAYYDNVQITANTGTDNIVITDMTGAEIVNVAPVAPVQTIDLSDKPAGHYILTVNGDTYEFFNKPEAN